MGRFIQGGRGGVLAFGVAVFAVAVVAVGWLVVELHAENPDYPTIVVQPGEPFEIEGLAVGLIRNTMLM